jgi:hypothetical protein
MNNLHTRIIDLAMFLKTRFNYTPIPCPYSSSTLHRLAEAGHRSRKE